MVETWLYRLWLRVVRIWRQLIPKANASSTCGQGKRRKKKDKGTRRRIEGKRREQRRKRRRAEVKKEKEAGEQKEKRSDEKRSEKERREEKWKRREREEIFTFPFFFVFEFRYHARFVANLAMKTMSDLRNVYNVGEKVQKEEIRTKSFPFRNSKSNFSSYYFFFFFFLGSCYCWNVSSNGSWCSLHR